MSDRYEKIRKALSHEIWAAAQTAPGEGIEDAVERVAALLARYGRQQAESAEPAAQAPTANADALDAARYRWLRERWGRITETYDGDSGRITAIGTEPAGEGWGIEPETLDAAIDAAMHKEGRQ